VAANSVSLRRSAGLLSVALLAGTLAGAAAPALPAAAADADALASGFADPPASARPRVWWHWMNGNVTKDGIRKDMEWMQRVGIGGLQNFDANLTTPQIVEQRLVYMTPEWKDAFRYAASLADSLGLELAIASSPGWSETGGPWVQPKDGLKKIVWSETLIEGGRGFAGRLPAPPAVTGPFQALPIDDPLAALGSTPAQVPPTYYADIAVLAYPVAGAAELPRPNKAARVAAAEHDVRRQASRIAAILECARG